MAPILAGLEILRVAGDDDEAGECARDTIERQAYQLVRLVDDLLDVSRITRGQLNLRRRHVDLAQIVQTAVETARPALEEAGHMLATELPAEVVILDADAGRLAQVFANLLTNAARYTPTGVKVRLRAKVDGGFVTVAVEDNGIGIPADLRERVFEMFTEIDSAEGRGQKGLGIGLTLARSLVALHGGDITAYSDGTFTVRVPLATGPSPAIEDRAPAGRSNDSARGQRVLVVDDNKDAAHTLALLLRLAGHDVRTADAGHAAIEIAAASRPHAVLMDLGMPGMTGYDAAQHIRAQPWADDMTLIALTGWGQEKDRLRTAEAGFDHHLVKPVDPAVLEDLLRNVQRERDTAGPTG